MSITGKWVRSWQTKGSDYVQYNLIVEVKNVGTGWAEIGNGDWTLYAKDESVLDTGNFSYAFPRYLAPGKTGYLADSGLSDEFKLKEVGRLDADGSYDTIDADEVVVLKTSKIKNKRDSYDGSWSTTGVVSNPTGEDIDSVHVGAFYLDSKGRPLGFSYTNLVDNLRAGKGKGFETLGDTPAIKSGAVAKTVVYASPSY